MRSLKKVWLGVALPVLLSAVAAGCGKDPQVAKRELIDSGDKFLAAKNYPEAIIQYRNALAIDPNLGETRLNLGRAYSETGDLPNALREYTRAADLLPEHVDAQLAAAAGLLAAGRFTDAKSRAEVALKKDPKNVNALLLLGNSLAGLRDLDGAIVQVQDAIDTDPQAVDSYMNLGRLELAKGNAAAAGEALKRAVEIAPDSLNAHLSLANYFWASGSAADTERELKKALELDPKSALANRALALFYSLSGRSDESEPYLRAFADNADAIPPKLQLIDYLVIKKKMPEATTLLDALVKTPEGYLPATRRLAGLEFLKGKREEAHRLLDEALSRSPRDEALLLQKTRFRMIEGKPAEALPVAEQIVTNNPVSVGGHFMKGFALKELGRYEEARTELQETLKLRPNEPAALVQMGDLNLALRNPASAQEFATQAIRLRPAAGEAHAVLARALLMQGKLEQLDGEIQGLLRGNPTAQVHVLAGDYYAARKETARARSEYDRALEANPRDIQAISGLTVLDLQQRKLAQARGRLEAKRKELPNSERLALLAGRVYASIRDNEAAEKAFKRAVEINPDSTEGYRSLAMFYFERQRLDDAKREFEELYKRDPSTGVTAATMIGTILTTEGKTKEARAQYQRALDLNPRAAIAANNIAWDMATNDENLDVALRHAQTAKAGLPDSPDVNDTLGLIYFKKGLTGQAIAAFEEASRQAPDSPGIKYRLGVAYAKNNEVGKARTALEQALKLNPNFKDADAARRQLAAMKS